MMRADLDDLVHADHEAHKLGPALGVLCLLFLADWACFVFSALRHVSGYVL